MQKVKNELFALVKGEILLNLERNVPRLGLANFRCIKWKGVSTLVAGRKRCWSSLFLCDGVYIYAYIYMRIYILLIFENKEGTSVSCLGLSGGLGRSALQLWALQNFNFQLYTLYWLGRQVSHYERIVISK